MNPSTSADAEKEKKEINHGINHADTAFCHEHKCEKNKSSDPEASFCRDATDADRDAKKAAGNMFGRYNKKSLNKLIESGDAQGFFAAEQLEALNKAKLLKDVVPGEKILSARAAYEKNISEGDAAQKEKDTQLEQAKKLNQVTRGAGLEERLAELQKKLNIN